jgi:hypothetical protein
MKQICIKEMKLLQLGNQLHHIAIRQSYTGFCFLCLLKKPLQLLQLSIHLFASSSCRKIIRVWSLLDDFFFQTKL